jgi:hypothetical protein
MWPTPTTQEVEHPDLTLTDTGRRLSLDGMTSHSLNLADSVKLWPTPTAHPENSNLKGKFPNPTLGDAVRMWPTMTANGMGSNGHRMMLDKQITAGTITPAEKLQMSAGNGGRLNPVWVEWLMGFPLGWTDLEA